MPDLPMKFRMVDPRSLRAHPRNPRRITTEGLDKIRLTIREVGFTSPVVVQASTGILIAGHQRTKAAIAEKLKRIPSIWVEVDDAAAEQLMLADNRLGEEAEWDERLLAELLKEMGAEAAAVTGFDVEEYERVIGVLEAQIDAVKGQLRRTRIDWERFAVFHACVGDQLFAIDRINYLTSFGHGQNRVAASKPPRSMLFVDSGMLQGAEEEGRRFLMRQPEVVAFAEDMHADWVAMMDIPRFPGILERLQLTPVRAYDAQLKAAREFADLETVVPRKVFTVQGPSFEEYERCARDYKGLVGVEDVVAIGGVKLRSRETEWVCELTQMVRDTFPVNRIHLFGVAYPPTVAKAATVGATSCDSASAASVHWNHVLVPVKRDGHYGVKKLRFEELLAGDRISIGGKVFGTLTAWNMVQGTAAVLMSAVAEEMALLLEMGATVEVSEPEPTEPEPKLDEEVD